MLPAQKTDIAYPALRDKLKPSQLTLDDVNRAIAGITPDTLAGYLSRCLREESMQRQSAERRTLFMAGLGTLLWIGLITGGGIARLHLSQWLVMLAGPVLWSLSICLSARRFRPLRHNALTALTTVIQDVHERESLEALCDIAAGLDGKKRSWEAEIEAATHTAIARILVRLSADEVAMLPEGVHQYLLQAISANRTESLTIAALLVLGSAQEHTVAPLVERLLQSTISEHVREAAEECQAELRCSL
jgi:hypothetical protein